MVTIICFTIITVSIINRTFLFRLIIMIFFLLFYR